MSSNYEKYAEVKQQELLKEKELYCRQLVVYDVDRSLPHHNLLVM